MYGVYLFYKRSTNRLNMSLAIIKGLIDILGATQCAVTTNFYDVVENCINFPKCVNYVELFYKTHNMRNHMCFFPYMARIAPFLEWNVSEKLDNQKCVTEEILCKSNFLYCFKLICFRFVSHIVSLIFKN